MNSLTGILKISNRHMSWKSVYVTCGDTKKSLQIPKYCAFTFATETLSMPFAGQECILARKAFASDTNRKPLEEQQWPGRLQGRPENTGRDWRGWGSFQSSLRWCPPGQKSGSSTCSSSPCWPRDRPAWDLSGTLACPAEGAGVEKRRDTTFLEELEASLALNHYVKLPQ